MAIGPLVVRMPIEDIAISQRGKSRAKALKKYWLAGRSNRSGWLR